MVGVRSSARSGSVVLAPPPSCLLKSPHALLAPEYRLALQVGSVPTPRVIMQAVFPWRQGTPCGDRIASVKFSQPERLPRCHVRASTCPHRESGVCCSAAKVYMTAQPDEEVPICI